MQRISLKDTTNISNLDTEAQKIQGPKQEENEQNDNNSLQIVDRLGYHIVKEIMFYLSPKELCTISLVNKKFKQISHEERVWEILYRTAIKTPLIIPKEDQTWRIVFKIEYVKKFKPKKKEKSLQELVDEAQQYREPKPLPGGAWWRTQDYYDTATLPYWQDPYQFVRYGV